MPLTDAAQHDCWKLVVFHRANDTEQLTQKLASHSHWLATDTTHGDTGTTAESPARGSETCARPVTTWLCSSRHSGVALASYHATNRVQIVSPRAQGCDWSDAGLHRQPAHADHQHSITLFTTRLHQRRPLPTKNRAANWWPCILCRFTSCMETLTNRTETHAVVDSNIQAPSQVFSFHHGVLTT